MKKTDHIFYLIKSLKKSEKRHFKLFVSLHVIGEKNNYLKLYDAIEKQCQKESGEYNEDEVRRLLAGERFISNLSELKYYLYKLILKSLTVYHSGINPEFQVNEYIQQVQILFDKGLYSQCELLLQKAKPIAEKYELFSHLLELYHWEIELMRLQAYNNKTERDIENLYSSIFDVLKKYSNVFSYSLMASRIFSKREKAGFTRSKTELKKYEEIIHDKLFESEDLALSYRAKYFYHMCYSTYYFINEDLKKLYPQIHKLVHLIESAPHQIQKNPNPYISILNNLIVTETVLKKFDIALDNIQKLRTLSSKSKGTNELAFNIANNLELSVYYLSGRFEEGVKLINSINAIRKKNKTKVTNKQHELLLMHHTAIVYFGAGNYAKANTYINKILNGPVNSRDDIYCFTKIMHLITHYEMGNDELLPYLIRSTYRLFYKRNRLYKFETVLLNYIKMLNKVSTREQLISLFKKLKTELLLITKDPFEKRALNYFDIISWLESKITNKPFSLIVQNSVA